MVRTVLRSPGFGGASGLSLSLSLELPLSLLEARLSLRARAAVMVDGSFPANWRREDVWEEIRAKDELEDHRRSGHTTDNRPMQQKHVAVPLG